MEKIWLREYPADVPAEIDLTIYASLTDIITESCERFADLPAYTNFGCALTFADVERLSRQFAIYLQQHAGLVKGDRVAIMLPNLLQFPVALFGVLRAGMTAVNVNPMYTARELSEQLRDSQAKAIVILENFVQTLRQGIEHTQIQTVITTRIGDLLSLPKSLLLNLVATPVKRHILAPRIPGSTSLGYALEQGKRGALSSVELSRDDIAFLQYTGGTTGVAKGAILTHGNMVANLQQVSAWFQTHSKPGSEIVITALPLYHIFALTANCLAYMKLGGHNVLITDPRDLRRFVKQLRKVRFTGITGVNTLFKALLHTPGFDRIDFGSLRLALGGGMAIQRSVAEQWQAVTGVPLLEGYGLTETSPVACINPTTVDNYNGTVGIPVPSTEIMIRDDRGREVPLKQQGEICIRGPQVMRGYWQCTDETKAVLDEDGWLRTGDIGYMDERGYVRLVDRKKDMILVSGFNVFPSEVEAVVNACPQVLEAAAVGVPDSKSGEAVKLVVVRKNVNLTAEELLSHCRRYLTAYKVPKCVEFRDVLPKSNVGKILRRALRAPVN